MTLGDTFEPGTFWIQPLSQGAALVLAVVAASGQVASARRRRRSPASRPT